MSHKLCCYQCGTSLAGMSLPLSRQDECPNCQVYLHVCRMCSNYDPAITRQCREDGADDVTDKDRLNFCDWFIPSESAFDPARKATADAARSALDSLFGAPGDDAGPEANRAGTAADDLFK